MLLWLINLGFAGGLVGDNWSDVSGNASIWTCANPTATTWDLDSTFWDLDGNVYKTLWDNLDDTWSDQSGNNPGWTDI